MEQPVILIAEDEHIVGQDLCETIEEAGYKVEGPHADVSAAMLAFQKRKPDLAILDVELSDATVYSFAETLMAEDIPVIFHSGYASAKEVHDRFPTSPTLSKPCPPGEMITRVQVALQTED